MKSFFKIFFASLLAIFVSGFLSVLMFIFSITAFDSLLSDETTVEVKDNSILKLTFSTPINDNPEVNSVNSIDFLTLEIPENLSLLNVLMSIEHAKNDHKIKGIYIEPSYFALSGFATIEEIRDALLDFKESGKFIISYADDYTQASYYMSSVADEIYINSVGSFGLKGLSTTLMFYKGLFEKLDIKPQIIRHGKYKSFIEPFTETEMSNENKKQTEELINSIWNTILTNISKERRLNPAGLSRAVSSLELVDPKLAVKFGLLDGIKHHDEVISQLMERVDVEKEKDLNFIGISDYSKSVLVNKSSDKIAIIYAEGDIVYGTGESGYISNKDIIKKFKKAKNDDDVKAIVFRINSGGGSALASELMWREIELVRQEKPVIVSFGNAAASGGYYIAAASDAIVCSPTTITGSIGVFSVFFNIGDALKNKLGITTSTVQTNDGASIMSPYRTMTKAEETTIQRQTDNFYETFVSRVAAGRNLSYEKVDEVAQGRVWSGTQAVEVGLVDGIGGLKHAILLAAEKAGLTQGFEYITISSEKSTMQLFVDALFSVKSKYQSDDILLNEIARIKQMIDVEPLQAKMPYDIEFETLQNSNIF